MNTYNLTITDILAAWGALIATSILIWDVIKWRRQRPVISILTTGIGYERNSVVEQFFALIDLSNIGSIPTTITNLTIESYLDEESFSQKKYQDKTSFTKEDGIPYTLKVGDCWQIKIPMVIRGKDFKTTEVADIVVIAIRDAFNSYKSHTIYRLKN